MAKAVLVMNMPESCFGCNFMYCDEESDTETCQAMETARDIDLIEDRPDWCPLRELPEKIPELKSGYEEVSTSIHRVGWNACLDEMVRQGVSDSVD